MTVNLLQEALKIINQGEDGARINKDALETQGYDHPTDIKIVKN